MSNSMPGSGRLSGLWHDAERAVHFLDPIFDLLIAVNIIRNSGALSAARSQIVKMLGITPAAQAPTDSHAQPAAAHPPAHDNHAPAVSAAPPKPHWWQHREACLTAYNSWEGNLPGLSRTYILRWIWPLGYFQFEDFRQNYGNLLLTSPELARKVSDLMFRQPGDHQAMTAVAVKFQLIKPKESDYWQADILAELDGLPERTRKLKENPVVKFIDWLIA